MRSIRTESQVDIVEVDGKEKNIPRPTLIIREHWNIRNYVVIQGTDGKEYTVYADDLKRAIENSQNAHRF